LKSSFALKTQSYVERCEIAGENIRGRYILNMISTEFDTANVSTSTTTSLELFQLPAPQDSVQGLKHWHDKVTYILSQFSVHQRPADEMLTHWAYNSLKRHPLLRLVTDRYQELPAIRTFDFLWEGVVTALRESLHDTNAQSIRDDLRKGPQSSTKAAVAPKGNEEGKEDKKSNDKAKPDPKAKGHDKQEGKGKGSPKSGTPKPPKSTHQGGNPPPCIFHARGKCTRANCPSSHDTEATSAAAASSGTRPSAKGQAPNMVPPLLVVGLTRKESQIST
jgi:hypothetical protein